FAADGYERRVFAAEGFEATGAYGRAVQAWRAAAQLLPAGDPRRLHVGVKLAEDFAARGERQDAISAFIADIRYAKARGLRNADLGEAYSGLADLLAAKGETRAARRNYRAALELTASPEVRADILRRLKAADRGGVHGRGE
ncbi:MAG: hypothetical protein KGM24_06220, partial [Elusimicrobia bacterium]|nr:hypothetical protein [Elusimicrobiota bacterium]